MTADGLRDQRLARARAAVNAYTTNVGGAYLFEPTETTLVDLVTDLRHYASAHAVCWSRIERAAEMHYRAERSGK